MDSDKILRPIAHLISIIFSPLIVPTIAVFLALWYTTVSFAPLGSRLLVLAAVFALTCMVPIICVFILYSLKVVKDPRLNDRADRFYPYTVAGVCYVGLAFFFMKVHAPHWLTAFVWGGVAIAIVAMIVNNWWKISGHSIEMGGLTALCFFICLRGETLSNSDLIFYIAIFCSGLVMSARLILHRHTLGQTIAGFALGFVFITISQLIA